MTGASFHGDAAAQAMNVEAYRSVASSAEVELVRKRSRFIGIAVPAETSVEAEAFLDGVRRRFPDATHHCYAYRVERAATVRLSDDGEPQGTAGRPILEVIERSGLENTCVAVVRYFGGTLLGAGGLARAYAAAANEAVAAAGIATYAPHALIRFELGYSEWGSAERNLARLGARAVEVSFAAQVRVELAVPEERAPQVVKFLKDLTAGAAEPQLAGRRFMPL